MFGLSPVEIVLIGAAAVMLYGKRLPEVGRTFGKTVGELRRQWTTLARELDVAAHVDGRGALPGGSRRSLPASQRDGGGAALVAGPRFDPPEIEG